MPHSANNWGRPGVVSEHPGEQARACFPCFLHQGRQEQQTTGVQCGKSDSGEHRLLWEARQGHQFPWGIPGG